MENVQPYLWGALLAASLWVAGCSTSEDPAPAGLDSDAAAADSATDSSQQDAIIAPPDALPDPPDDSSAKPDAQQQIDADSTDEGDADSTEQADADSTEQADADSTSGGDGDATGDADATSTDSDETKSDGDAGSTPVDVDAQQPASEILITGKVDTTDAFIGLWANGTKSAAYVCGGPNSVQTITRWFAPLQWSGEIGASSFSGSTDDWTLEGTVADGGAVGTLLEAGQAVMNWTASDAPGDTLAGLYFAKPEVACHSGFIALQDSIGVEAETVGAMYCNDVISQVTPILPVSLVNGGIPVEGVSNSGDPLAYSVMPFDADTMSMLLDMITL